MGSIAGHRPHPCSAAGGFAPVPRLVQWMATAQCSYGCPHCLSAAPTGKQLTLSEVSGLIDEVASLGVHEFLVTGGEPLERADLPEVIAQLARRRQRWSLNTSRAPAGALLAAIHQWPPAFAAVSVDGPAAFHDRFRGRPGAFDEAMRAISILSSLTGGQVAAGTTVTARNIGLLHDTLGLVIASGASSWGLHLVVPEGRARARSDLMLSASHVRQLLRFTARRRDGFPVMMADELGYCGSWEPLVRSEPFYCGAGREQCVILPDGEVVPCTTLDRSESAGSLRVHTLEAIWAGGFSALRARSVPRECESCAYLAACGGGCWLQRKHGTHCFKRCWERSGALASAGLALCLGLPGCPQREPPVLAPAPVASIAPSPSSTAAQVPAPRQLELQERKLNRYGFDLLDWLILKMYVGRSRTSSPEAESLASSDPGFAFLADFLAAHEGPDLAHRASRVQAALQTRQRSLQLAALLWRDLAEVLLDGPGPERRSEQARALVRTTLADLRVTSERWREEVVAGKLDPFLRRDGVARSFFRSKAGPPPELAGLAAQARKRWASAEITREYLLLHPIGESLTLVALEVRGPVEHVHPAGAPLRKGDKLGPYALIVVGSGEATLSLSAGSEAIGVRLAAGTEYTLADLLRAAFEQNSAWMQRRVEAEPGASEPLLLAALRAKLRASSPGDEQGRARLERRLADLWMF